MQQVISIIWLSVPCMALLACLGWFFLPAPSFFGSRVELAAEDNLPLAESSLFLPCARLAPRLLYSRPTSRAGRCE